MAPAERIDVIIDFSECNAQRFVLSNDAPAPYTHGGQVVPTDVMLFAVTKALNGPDASRMPDQLGGFQFLNPAEAVRERVLAITEMDRATDGYTEIGLLGDRHWSGPITEDPKAGSTEIWTFANTTGDVHPLHVHLVHFQVLNRQPFDVKTYLESRRIVFTGNPIAPETNERPAWKDTVKTYPGYLTRVIHRFDLPEGTQTRAGQEFLYVWHCHMLEHEDNEMMRPYKVIG
jgi:spore coat protein A, manganese oxidase